MNKPLRLIKLIIYTIRVKHAFFAVVLQNRQLYYIATMLRHVWEGGNTTLLVFKEDSESGTPHI